MSVRGKVASHNRPKSNSIAAIRADKILIDKLQEMLIVLGRQHGCVRHTADADFVGAAILLDFLEELLGWLGHVCQKVLEAKQDQRRGICGRRVDVESLNLHAFWLRDPTAVERKHWNLEKHNMI